MNPNEAVRLPCGARLVELIDQVADGRQPADPEHQATCPHCQAALGELEELWGRVRALAREEVSAPYRLVQTVMRRIREQGSVPALLIPLEQVVPRLVRHALVHEERGVTRIADSVLARIASLALREISLAEVASSGARALRRGSATECIEVRLGGDRALVALRLVADYGVNLPSLADLVRQTVAERIRTMTGLEAVEVDIHVVDVRLRHDR